MKSSIKRLEYLTWGLVFLVIALLAICTILYRYTYSGGISDSSNDWGAVGSFFGGIFSPLIAFATLIAIIITITLQKEIIATQKSEFEKLLELQSNTLSAQREQLDLARDDSKSISLVESKKLYLGLFEQHALIQNSIIEKATNGATFMIEKRTKGFNIEDSAIEENLKRKEAAERCLGSLLSGSTIFAFEEFDSEEKMKNKAKEIISDIFKSA
ncbi:hypothetical protein D3C78_1065550 [compost metagenome]